MEYRVTICQAIAQRRLLTFSYDGSERVVEPHVYGVDAHGEALLSAYQVSGGSVSGNPEGWKFFRMHKMLGLRALDRHFSGPRLDYQHDDAVFATIQCQL